MLKFINLKKLTAHSLVGILFAANFVTNLSSGRAVASQDNADNVTWSVYTDSNFAPVVDTPGTPLPTRTLVNPSFEYPNFSIINWYSLDNYIPGDDSSLQGWFSTHPTTGYSGSGNSRFKYADGTPYEHLVEIWANGVFGVPAPNGTQFAELNAQAHSALYQDICVMAGEQMRWTASHRGRSKADIADKAEVFISNPDNWSGVTFSGNKPYRTIIGTSNDGSPSSITPETGSAGQQTATSLNNGWMRYSDVWTGPSTSQEYRIAFQSVSTGNNNLTYGNFLDDIQIELSPTIEFVETDETNQVNLTNVEGDIYYLTVRVNGTLLSQGTVDITPTGNTNISGSDFSIGTLVAGDGAAVATGVSATDLDDGTIRLTLPPGTYDRNNTIDYITIPLSFSEFSDIKNATYQLTDSNMSGGGEGDLLNLRTLNGSGNCSSDTEHTFALKSSSYDDGSDSEVSLELVLSVDVSGSVSNGEYNKQVQGYVKAFRDSVEVQNAIKNLDKGMVVTMQFWAVDEVIDIGWFKLVQNGDSIDGLDEFINAMNSVSRNKDAKTVTYDGTTVNTGSGTDIQLAINQAVALIESNEYEGERLVIDVSGDGIPDDTPYPEATKSAEYGYKNGECGYTFDCPPVENARDAAIAKGITINGLPINNSSAGTKTGIDIFGNNFSVSNLADRVDEYYASQVVGGTNAFSLLADGFDDFDRAAELKIRKEISNDPTCNADDGCSPPIPNPEEESGGDSDADNNGILDADEFARDGGSETADLDGDGVPNYQDLDDDGDNIPDVMELHTASEISNTGTKVMTHTLIDGTTVAITLPNPPTTNITDSEAIESGDSDSIPDYRDEDSDGDTIKDIDEAGDTDLTTVPADEDNDGTPNYLDDDSDGDNISDAIEAGDSDLNTAPRNTDGSDLDDYLDSDSDNDYISDEDEAGNITVGQTPLNSDGTTNDDGSQKYDYIDNDSDNDYISDKDEAGDTDLATPPINTDGTDNPDYLDDDSDNDTISDEDEAGDLSLSTAPYDSDATVSGDGIPDFRDLDSDDNTILDEDEVSAANDDIDGDNIDNFRDLDDDGDNIPDVVEIGGGASPLNSDGANDGDDYQDTDSDNDSIEDSAEGISTIDSTSVEVTYSSSSSPTSYNLLDTNPDDTEKDGSACVDLNSCTIEVNPTTDGDGTVEIDGTVTGLNYQVIDFGD